VWCRICRQEARRSGRSASDTDIEDLATWAERRAGVLDKRLRVLEEMFSSLQRRASARGGCLLSDHYNGRGYYRFRCALGHELQLTDKEVISGKWCDECERRRSVKRQQRKPSATRRASDEQERSRG
jgi:hypothetical protein